MSRGIILVAAQPDAPKDVELGDRPADTDGQAHTASHGEGDSETPLVEGSVRDRASLELLGVRDAVAEIEFDQPTGFRYGIADSPLLIRRSAWRR